MYTCIHLVRIYFQLRIILKYNTCCSWHNAYIPPFYIIPFVLQTSNTLCFTLHMLAQHPHVQEKLAEEMTSQLNGRSPTAEDLKNMSYLKCIVKETLRLVKFGCCFFFGGGVTQIAFSSQLIILSDSRSIAKNNMSIKIVPHVSLRKLRVGESRHLAGKYAEVIKLLLRWRT